MMKHFDKMVGVEIQLDFPEDWGDPSRIVDETSGDSLYDVVWRLWADDIGKSPFYGLGLAAIEDITNGFDVADVRVRISHWKTEDQLNRTIEWLEKRLRMAYKRTTKASKV